MGHSAATRLWRRLDLADLRRSVSRLPFLRAAIGPPQARVQLFSFEIGNELDHGVSNVLAARRASHSGKIMDESSFVDDRPKKQAMAAARPPACAP